MNSIYLEYIDKEILERVAEIEKQQRPYPSDVEGVGYSDIIELYGRLEAFDAPPMVMIPDRLDDLSGEGYLRQVSSDQSVTTVAYRLTQRGWRTVGISQSE